MLVAPVEPVPVDRLGRIHFVGIGGAGMSGIARILLGRGVPVSGSDSAASPMLAELAALGADVHAGHAAAHLGAANTVVVSSAIRADNPELLEARRRGLRVLPRAAALAALMLGRRGIAVAGTHGKTTTTGMLATVLRCCGADPGYVVGGVLAETGRGADDGDGTEFVVEADESDGSFLMLSPAAAVVTNVEADHLDNYASLTEISAAFAAFTRRIAPGGLLVACRDDPGAWQVADGVRAEASVRASVDASAGDHGEVRGGDRGAGRGGSLRVRSYGTAQDAEYRISAITPLGMRVGFTVTATTPSGTYHGEVSTGVPGRHNALNAAAAFATAVELGFPPPEVAAALARYRGARRRMEAKGAGDGVRVFDSYAHHPTELAADLLAARDIAAGGRVVVVFQPHLVSRTKMFATQFGAALTAADEVIVLDVYAAREDPDPRVTGRLVADAVPGGRARYLPATGEVAPLVADVATPGDVVLTMGAGDVTNLGSPIVAALRARKAAGGGGSRN